MGVEWVSRMRTKVSGRIKDEFSEALMKKYNMTKDNNFSTRGKSDTKAFLPFVYIQMLSPAEVGRDLEGTEINAGLFTFQIDVTATKWKDAEEISIEILRIMKGMRFEVTSMPSFEDTSDTHRSTARYRRYIGDGGKL